LREQQQKVRPRVFFATLSKPNGESFVPVFSNILSFAKWYNHADFGVPFQAHDGLVLIWQLKDLQAPSTGINELEDVLGVAIDPFDAVDYDKSVILCMRSATQMRLMANRGKMGTWFIQTRTQEV
jgi:hypothetical protein